MTGMSPWLARVQHDLVKRLLWPARDRREMGGAPAPGELLPRLIDEEGRPTTAAALWAGLRDEAAAPAEALDAFGAALDGAVRAAERGHVDGVLALDGAFRALVQAATMRQAAATRKDG
jgi:hypothetical protein